MAKTAKTGKKFFLPVFAVFAIFASLITIPQKG